MEFLTNPVVWTGAIILAVLPDWLEGFFTQFLQSPQRMQLAIANAFKSKSPMPEQRFRLVLCWLQNDPSGRDMSTVEEAFIGVEGIELVRSVTVSCQHLVQRTIGGQPCGRAPSQC